MSVGLPEIQLERNTQELVSFKHELKASLSGVGKLVAALAAARPGFETIKKTTKNPFYNKFYADIAAIIDATAVPLAKQGVYVLQFPSLTERFVGVTTLVAHSSGEWIESTISGCPAEQKTKEGTKFDAQTIGIAITYCRRYSLQAALNLAAEDDDGNGLVDQSDKKEQPKRFGQGGPITNGVPNSSTTRPVSVKAQAEIPLMEKLTNPLNVPTAVQVSNADSEGCPLSDEDLKDLLPTDEEKKAYGGRLKALKQDTRLLRNYIEKKGGRSYTLFSKKQYEEILPPLEEAFKSGAIGELLKS